MCEPAPLTRSACSFALSVLQELVRRAQRGVPGVQAARPALHLEHEDHVLHGAGGHHEGDPQGPGRQQL